MDTLYSRSGYGLRVVTPGYLLRNPNIARTVVGEGDILVVTGYDSQVLEAAAKTLPLPRVHIASIVDEGFILLGGAPSNPVVALALWHPSTRWASPIVMSEALRALDRRVDTGHGNSESTKRALVVRAVNGHLAGLDTTLATTPHGMLVAVGVLYRSLTTQSSTNSNLRTILA